MKIETRVEALELELKILKSEIQSTLLEIREQVLNHYYPELRAEEPQRARVAATRPTAHKPNESRTGKSSQEHGSQERDSLERDRQERGNNNGQAGVQAKPTSLIEAMAPIQPFSDIFLQDMEQEDDDQETDYVATPRRLNKFSIDNASYDNTSNDDDGYGDDGDDDYEGDIDALEDMDDITPPSYSSKVTPKTREVNYQQLKQAPVELAPKAKARPERVEAQEPKSNRRNFAALAAWVGDSIAKVGKERTIQVVETYAATGALPSETKSSILQLVSLADDAEPAGPVGNREKMSLMVALDQVLGDQ